MLKFTAVTGYGSLKLVFQSHLTLFQSRLTLFQSDLILFQSHLTLFRSHLTLFWSHLTLFQSHPTLFQSHLTLFQLHLTLFQSHLTLFWLAHNYWAPIRGYWHYYWHFVISSQNVKAKAKCLSCQEFMLGLLSAVVTFTPWQTLLLKSPKSECICCWGDRQHCTCTTVCTGVGKWLHILPSHAALGEPQGFSWGTLTNTALVYM